jgi:hypothetical protein
MYHNFTLPDVLTGQLSPAACQRTQLSINCWGFAYDVLLSAQSNKQFFTLSLAHPQVAWSVLTAAAFSLPLQSSNSTPDFFTNASVRNSGLLPGDYILIYHQRQPPPCPLCSLSYLISSLTRTRSPSGAFLDHIAIHLDFDVLFERAGAGDNVPFRVTDWASLTSVWQPGVFDFAVRRSLQSDAGARGGRQQQPFPDQGQAFGLHNDVTLQQLPELKAWVSDAVARVFAASPEFSDDKHSVVNGNACARPHPFALSPYRSLQLLQVRVGCRHGRVRVPGSHWQSCPARLSVRRAAAAAPQHQRLLMGLQLHRRLLMGLQLGARGL